MAFGIQNNVIPPAPEVNSEVYNIVALVGIAPRGPRQQLVLCASDTDDSQFGSALTDFTIPRALNTHRLSGGGSVVAINVYDPTAHTSFVAVENESVVSQKCATEFNPVDASVAAIATIRVTTQSALNDTLAGLSVNTNPLMGGALTFVAGSTTPAEQQIAGAINAFTNTSGYSAVAGTGEVTIKGPVALGCTINTVVITVGTITGTLVLATPTAFASGVGGILVQNTPVAGVSAVGATTTVTITTGTGSSNNNTIASLMVGIVNLFSAPLVIASNQSTTQSAAAIATAINAYTGTSGFSATSASAVLTIIGPTSAGATINGVVPVFGAITGTGTLAIGTPGAMGSVIAGVTAVTAVPAYTYVVNNDYTIDDYGNITFLIAITDGSVVRLTYSTLNQSAVTAGNIIGTVSGSTRTGLQLLATSQMTLQVLPKILIVPYWNRNPTVATAMSVVANSWQRMRYIIAAPFETEVAAAIASRGPSGSFAPFNTSDKRAILADSNVLTYDPQSGTNTLDDPSAALAGFLAWNASINGPQVSPSNQVMPAVAGTDLPLMHSWEDPNNQADTNQLRSNGISCIFSNGGGYKWWGNENASYPNNQAVDCNIPTIYVNDIISDNLTAFAINLIDTNITSGSIAGALTAMNGYYAVLMASGWIGPDSIVKFIAAKNPSAQLKAGTVVFTRSTYYFVGMKLIVLTEDMEVQLPQLNQ